MGAVGGRFSVDEYQRGACGSMASCEMVEAHAAILADVQSGAGQFAHARLVQPLPLLIMGSMFRQSAVKRILVKRGLLQPDHFRDANPPLDSQDAAEIDWIYASLEHLMTAKVSPPKEVHAL